MSALLLRSTRAWISVPAPAVNRYDTAKTSGAHVALVDLEDSVAPAKKQHARTIAERFFDGQATSPCLLGVRMNAPVLLDGIKDLAAMSGWRAKPAVVLVPKVESARDIELVAGVLDAADYQPFLFALIETPRAIEKLPSIVRASRISGLVFGTADYAAALGCGMGWEPMLHARSVVANSAASAGLAAIDSPYFQMDDPDGLRQEAERAKALGFHGKGAIHTGQLPVITELFTPSQEEIAHARAVVAAAQDSGSNITSVDGQMVGRPFFTMARSVLEAAGTREEPTR
ncbi:HpcH/HpaI aldolase/citrate lyase family protein [Kitasatospora sp. NPDC017646]|uniref:HpcH/HpaI aldolase/citrate lyase family protein n=1 Tax=Kitasatospora sp. NPDC017646 TaxID=3364024 RepID=UPI00378C0205